MIFLITDIAGAAEVDFMRKTNPNAESGKELDLKFDSRPRLQSTVAFSSTKQANDTSFELGKIA